MIDGYLHQPPSVLIKPSHRTALLALLGLGQLRYLFGPGAYPIG